MQLASVGMKNFRAFADVQLDFTKDGEPLRCVLLVGPNAAGKTTVLDAISKLFSTFYPEYGGGPFLRTDVRVGSGAAEVLASWTDLDWWHGGLMLEGGYAFAPDEHPFPANYTMIEYPATWIRDVIAAAKSPLGMILRFDLYRFLLGGSVPGPNVKAGLRHRCDNALAPTIQGRNVGERFEQIQQWLVNQDFYRVKAKADRNEPWPPWEQIVEALNFMLAPYRFSRIDDYFRVLFTDPSGAALPIEAMSDGIRSLFVIIGELILRLSMTTEQPDAILSQEAVCLIDEIDAHLHPKWQQRALPGLMTLFPNVQFIATTHSPFVVESVPQASVFKLVEEEEK